MSFPAPAPGQVIAYSYLWRSEQELGRSEGVKDRPCAVLLARLERDGRQTVLVLPITHRAPADPSDGIEIPVATKRRLGLDGQRSWIVLTEANRFAWPGPDLRPRRVGVPGSVLYGLLPRTLFEEVRRRFVERVKAGQAAMAHRTE